MIVDGQAIEGPSLDRAVIFQSHALLPWRTVMGNVAYAVSSKWRNWDTRQGPARTRRNSSTSSASPAPSTSGRRNSPAA